MIKGSAFKQGCTEGDIEHALDNTMFWYDMGDFDMCIGPIPAGELLEVGVNRDGDVFHAMRARNKFLPCDKVMTMATDEEILARIEADEDRIKSGPYSGAPIRALRAAVANRRAADEALTAAVKAARASGASWASVGSALGVSRQAAAKRYAAAG